MSDRRLFLLRLHKTASTSFAQALMKGFPSERICPLPFAYQFQQRRRSELDRYSFFWPHMGIPQARVLYPEAELTTVVRDPAARLLSAFHFWKDQLSGMRPERLRLFLARFRLPPGLPALSYALQSMSLVDFLRSEEPRVLRASDNAMVRFFAGASFGKRSATRVELDGVSGAREELYERALAGLDSFRVVGVAEHFVRSLERMRIELDLDVPVEELRVNVGRGGSRAPLNAEEREALEPRVEWDRRLYDEIVRRLEDRSDAPTARRP